MSATCGTEKELNFLLIGKTGEGKSATGNAILGQRLFHEAEKTTSETQDVTDKFASFEGYILKVVDCPGLMDTYKNSNEDTEAPAKNMCIALGKCNGGVDAFILVITRRRFTGEQRQTLEVLKQIFGDQYLKNLMVVVTGGDTFQEDMEYSGYGDISFHEWCRQQEGDFKKLYEEFKNRFLLVNNREKDSKKRDAQRREIIHLAETLRKGNSRYTSESFKQAKDLRDKLIVEANTPMLNEIIQKKVGLLTTDLLKLKTTPSDAQRESIQQSVNDLKTEITEQDKGTGLLNHLLVEVEKVEKALHDVNELQSLAKKLEDSRKGLAIWSMYRALFAELTADLFAAVWRTACMVAAPGGLVAGATFHTGAGATCMAQQACKFIAEHVDLSTTEKHVNAKIDAIKLKLNKVTIDGKRK